MADDLDLRDRLIPAANAARMLGVPVETLRHWHARRAGPAAAEGAGAELAYWRSEIEDWQDRLGVPPEPADDESVVHRLPDGLSVVSVLRASYRGGAFEVRRGSRVLASFVSLPGACGFVAQLET